jgi:hypothetical protein
MTPTLDRPPAGWHVLVVVRRTSRKWDWSALMIDVHPDEMKHSPCKEAWVRVPGKHRNYDAACEAVEAMIATKH